MQSNDVAIMRESHVHNLRLSPRNQESIRFLVENSNKEYKMLLSHDLVDYCPNSENLLIFFKSLIDVNLEMHYNKDENKFWINKISDYIVNIDENDIGIAVHKINTEMAKKPLIAREIILEILKEITKEDSINKLERIDSDSKENFLDKRHYQILSKKYSQNGALVRAYEILEKIPDSSQKINLKNQIVIKIGEFLCKENQIKVEELSRGLKNGQKSLDVLIIKIMSRHSNIFRFEYGKLLEVEKEKTIAAGDVIDSLKKIHEFSALDLFIDEEIKDISIIEQLKKCKLISTSGIIGRILENDVAFEELCFNLVDICKNISKDKREIVLSSFLENRKIISAKSAEKIINYIKLIKDSLGSITLLRAAKLCEKINKLRDGIFILDGLKTKSALNLREEFEKKLLWLENGYDFDSIIEAHREMKIETVKNKILYFVHSDLPFVTSGYTIRTKSVIKALSDKGYDIETMSRWGFPLDREISNYKGEILNKYIDENKIIHNFSPSKEGMRRFHDIEYITKGVEEMLIGCQHIKPSIIISASDHVTGLIGLIVSKILGIPFFYEMRGLWAFTRATNNSEYKKSYDYALRLRLEKQCALGSNRVITISEELKKVIIKWGIKEENINLLPNGIGSIHYPKNTGNLFSKTIKIGYIGSIVPYEGLMTSIKAIEMIRDRNRGEVPKLIIAGEGSEKEQLEKYSQENNLQDFIEFRGRIEHEEVEHFYKELDCVILPRLSTLVTEIVPPLKPLEAIANGKIVLSSKIGPHNELFDNISGSFRFIPGDINSQVKVIDNFIDYEGDYQDIIKNSFDYITNNRNYNKMINGIAKDILYFQLIGLEKRSHSLSNINDLIAQINYSEEEFYETEMITYNKKDIIDLIRKFDGNFKRDLYLSILRKLTKTVPEFCLELAKEMQFEINDDRAIMSIVRSANRSGMYGFANLIFSFSNFDINKEIKNDIESFWDKKAIKDRIYLEKLVDISKEFNTEKINTENHANEREKIVLLIRKFREYLNEGIIDEKLDLTMQIISYLYESENINDSVMLEWFLIFIQYHHINESMMRELIDNQLHNLAALIYDPEINYNLNDEELSVVMKNIGENEKIHLKIKKIKKEFDQLVKEFRKGNRDSSSDKIITLGNKLITMNSISLTPLFHVVNAYIHNGKLDLAIETLEKSRWREHSNVIPKLKNYKSQLSWLHNGYSKESSLEEVNYTPVKGRVVYTLHNSLPFNTGGYATRSHGIAVGLKKLGWDVHIVTRMGYPHDRKGIDTSNFRVYEEIEGIKYHRIYSEEIGFGKNILIEYLEHYKKELQKIVIKIKPEIIHAASNYWNGLVAIEVADSLSIPSVYEVRGLWEVTRSSRQKKWNSSDMYKIMARLETQAVVTSTGTLMLTEALKNEFKNRGVERTDISILPNGVNVRAFVPRKRDKVLLNQLNIKEDKIIIGYIGSIVNYEGLDLLMESAAKLREEIGELFTIMIVGDGKFMPKVIEASKNNKVDDITIFTGRIPHSEVAKYYSIIDIAPFPRLSLPVTEMVSPLKPFEAMAMEKAIICSNVDAMNEFIFPMTNGMIFEKNDSEDLKNKMKELVLDKKKRVKLGKNARKWVIKNRDWGEISKVLSKKYIQVIKKESDK